MSHLEKLRHAQTLTDVANIVGFKPSRLARIIHGRLEGCGFGTPVTVAPAARVVGA